MVTFFFVRYNEKMVKYMSWSEPPKGTKGRVLGYCVGPWVRRYYRNWIFIITEAHATAKKAKIITPLHILRSIVWCSSQGAPKFCPNITSISTEF